MAYRDLREFIRALEKNRELTRIAVEVDPILEITEITAVGTRLKLAAVLGFSR